MDGRVAEGAGTAGGGSGGADLGTVCSHGYVYQVGTACVCRHVDYRVLEVPICFGDRRIGKSKMMVKVKLEATLRFWEVLWHHRCLLSPLREG